jgi:hypothetical protein
VQLSEKAKRIWKFSVSLWEMYQYWFIEGYCIPISIVPLAPNINILKDDSWNAVTPADKGNNRPSGQSNVHHIVVKRSRSGKNSHSHFETPKK